MRPAKRRQVIANMLDHEGPLTIRELGALVSIDHTTISVDLHNMELEGIVSRTENEGWRARPASKRSRFTYKLERAP